MHGFARFLVVLIASASFFTSPLPLAQTKSSDPLRNWNIGPTKTAVLQFVQDVTTEGGLYYVPPSDRIAVIEVDGVLLPTIPYPAELAFDLDRVKAFLAKNPRYRSKEPFKSALSGNTKQLASGGSKAITQLTSTMYAGTTTDEFDNAVLSWLSRGRIQKLNRLYTQSAYLPMQEFIACLRTNGFRVYAISGGTVEFLRPWSEKILGFLPDHLLGGMVGVKIEKKGDTMVMRRRADATTLGERGPEAEGIFREIGKRPIIYAGTSDNQLETMQWVSYGSGRHLTMIIHHTDSGNEFSYDSRSPFGKLEKALSGAKDNGWVVVDMLKDWNKVFTPSAK
jgi:hypothetical protein